MSTLAFYRKRKNLTQSELGKKLGVSKQLVSAWETGSARIDPRHAENLKTVFVLTEEQLREIMENVPQVESEKEKNTLDSILDAVMHSDIDATAKVKIYTLISDAKRKESAEGTVAEVETVNVDPLPPDHLQGPDQITVDFERAIESLKLKPNEETRTPRGKTDGGRVFNYEIRCPGCQSIFFVSKIRISKKIGCPFCGQHIIVK